MIKEIVTFSNGVYVLIVVTLLFGFYYMLKELSESKVIEKTIEKGKQSTEERKKNEISLRLEDGEQEKENFLYRFDLMIEQSGINRVFNGMTSELYLIAMFSISIISFIVVNAITNFWFFGCVAIVLVCAVMFMFLYYMQNINMKKIEKSVLKFANLIDNFSMSSDDIVDILYRTSFQLDDPLKTYILEFRSEVMLTGDIRNAFKNLETKVSHPQFKDIIRNIDICSRHQANYGEIIALCRQRLLTYIDDMEEKKAIYNNARVEIILLIVLGGFVIGMFSTMIDNMFTSLASTVIGNGILIYCIAVLIYATWNIFNIDK